MVIRERLADGAGNVLDTVYRHGRPAGLAYSSRGGGQAVIVGGVRWTAPARPRAGSAPRRTRSTSPAPDWRRAVDASLLRPGVVSFRDPTIPAWFEVSLDRRTGLPLRERMVAPAHFMDRRYRRYGAPLRVAPPVLSSRGADRVAERVEDRVAAVGAHAAGEEALDVGADRVLAGVRGDASDRAGAAQRGERGRGVGVGETHGTSRDVGDREAGGGEELGERVAAA